MRVLVTGCYGQVGHCLTEQLKDKADTEVLALDRENLDITDSDAVQKAVRDVPCSSWSLCFSFLFGVFEKYLCE